MAESKPATKIDVFYAMLIIATLIFLSAWLLWQPTRDAVQRIEQRCTQTQK